MSFMKSVAFLCLFVGLCAYAEEEEKKEQKLGTIIGIDLGTTYSWLVSSTCTSSNSLIISFNFFKFY